MDKILIKNAHIVSDGKILLGDVYIESGIIKEVADHISAKSPDVKALFSSITIFLFDGSRPNLA